MNLHQENNKEYDEYECDASPPTHLAGEALDPTEYFGERPRIFLSRNLRSWETPSGPEISKFGGEVITHSGIGRTYAEEVS